MIGRQKERSRLLEAFSSEDSEFVAVYGRRRVGKTFLVRETFGQSFTFQHTGVKNGSRQIQLSRFRQSMLEQGHPGCPELKDWFDAFDNLKTVIKASAAERKVVFIDEIPWMGRSDQNFISAVENFAKDVVYIPVSATGVAPSVNAETNASGFRVEDMKPVWATAPIAIVSNSSKFNNSFFIIICLLLYTIGAFGFNNQLITFNIHKSQKTL